MATPVAGRLHDHTEVSVRPYGNQTQALIAEQIGVSQMHVSRLITKTLAQLRTHLEPRAD